MIISIITNGDPLQVRLVARLFYAEEVPPPELPLDDVPAPRRSKGPQASKQHVVSLF